MPTLGDGLVVIKLVLLPAFNLLSMLTYTPLYESKERKSVCESVLPYYWQHTEVTLLPLSIAGKVNIEPERRVSNSNIFSRSNN